MQALLKLNVDTAANLLSAQKKIQRAFDKFRLVIVPNSTSDYIVCLSLLDLFAWGLRRCHPSAKSNNWFCGMQLHILDPSLGSEMINNTILNASGAAVKFADIDGAALQFVTETRPTKRAFAWHAEEALHWGKAVGWPAASLLTVPPSAWSSDTCDSSIRDQYFHDLLELQAAAVSDQDEVCLQRAAFRCLLSLQTLEAFQTQALIAKDHCCHCATLHLVYISTDCNRMSLVVCHAVGTLHCQTSVIKRKRRFGALEIYQTCYQIAATYQQAKVRITGSQYFSFFPYMPDHATQLYVDTTYQPEMLMTKPIVL